MNTLDTLKLLGFDVAVGTEKTVVYTYISGAYLWLTNEEFNSLDHGEIMRRIQEASFRAGQSELKERLKLKLDTLLDDED